MMKIYLGHHRNTERKREPGGRFNGDNREENVKFFQGKREYELRCQERMSAGEQQKGFANEYQQQLYEVEALLDLQSKQLSKLAVYQNQSIYLDLEDKVAQRKDWDELIQPSEAILRDIHEEIFHQHEGEHNVSFSCSRNQDTD